MGTDEDAKEPEPRLQGEYWVLFDGQRVSVKSTRRSPDGRFHVCRKAAAKDGAVIRPEAKEPCLWVPVMGS